MVFSWVDLVGFSRGGAVGVRVIRTTRIPPHTSQLSYYESQAKIVLYFSIKKFNILNRKENLEMDKLVKVKENRVAISLRNNSSDTILFRLVNIKRSTTKAFNIFESVKYSTNLKDAFNNNYRSIDYTYEALSNNRLKNVNLLSKIALRSNLKDKYLELINSNTKFINDNKSFKNRDKIIKANNYYKDLINNLK